MIKLTTLLLYCLCVTANATTIGLHIGSKHDKPGFNDNNPGLYIKTDKKYTFGTVYNSVNKQAYYAGYTYDYQLTNNLEASVTLGGITGYNAPVTPMIIPSVSYNVFNKAKVRIAFLPQVYKNGSNAITLMIENRF